MAKKKKAKRSSIPVKSRTNINNQEAMLRYMRILEMNDMNVRKTARDVGVHENTMRKYRDTWWETYAKQNNVVALKMNKTESINLSVIEGFNEIKDTIQAALTLAVQRATEILSDEDKLKSLNHRDLVQLINVLAPYVAEKRGLLGVEELNPNNPFQKHTTFVQNIMNQMNIKKEYYAENTSNS